MEQRCILWPSALPLTERYLQNCLVLPDRNSLLRHMPKRAACAEVGVLIGDFSELILRCTDASELHLIDIQPMAIEAARRRFNGDNGIRFHLGDSSQVLKGFPQRSLDWIYLDGDHSYPAVKRDLEAARQVVKRDGLIALNDYTFFGPSDFQKYGVMEALHEFCLEYDFEWVFLALQGRGYHDVVIRPTRVENHQSPAL